MPILKLRPLTLKTIVPCYCSCVLISKKRAS